MELEAVMDYRIRAIGAEEHALLTDFLYEAIFVPEGVPAPPRSIVERPELQVYVADFGRGQGDTALVAEVEGRVVGAVWARIMADYGHVDDQTPSLAVALYPAYRGAGIGTALMRKMLRALKGRGYRQASLAVQKASYAVKLYQALGFAAVAENEAEYIMVCPL